ncbi:MAG: hypothetical protein K6G54_08775 [Oscillospiraceae bacterium]|nr:hypothetical protein [Oscillospiraceae bacterium]
MKLSPQERAARRAAFRQMDAWQKTEYLFTYYKVPILLGLILLVILCSSVRHRMTKKEAALYAAMVNVSVGESLERQLTVEFLDWSGENVQKKEVYLYRDLYLSDDASVTSHEYAYASRLKLLGAINAKKLDVVLMNREGYAILSRSGYLWDLSDLLHTDGELRRRLAPYLSENEVVIEDNAIEYNLNEAPSYQETTAVVANAVEVSSLPAFQAVGFSDSVYLGIIANSTRSECALRYLAYLLDR